MNATALAAAIARAWSRVYTWRLPTDVRDARRAELESDVWESLRNDSALHILGRVAMGIPDDIRWRMESRWAAPRRARLTIALGVAAGLLLAAAWAGTMLGTVEPPPPPAAPILDWRPTHYPPPPPPPPPPCNPSFRPQVSPCTRIT